LALELALVLHMIPELLTALLLVGHPDVMLMRLRHSWRQRLPYLEAAHKCGSSGLHDDPE
jgi:hypothetical protein